MIRELPDIIKKYSYSVCHVVVIIIVAFRLFGSRTILCHDTWQRHMTCNILVSSLKHWKINITSFVFIICVFRERNDCCTLQQPYNLLVYSTVCFYMVVGDSYWHECYSTNCNISCKREHKPQRYRVLF